MVLSVLASLTLVAVAPGDWLLYELPAKAEAIERPEANELVLTNGLISRTFRLAPDFATVDFQNHMTGATIVRGVKPEAEVTLNGKPVEVGGLKGQRDYAYLDPAWLDELTATPEAFHYVSHEVVAPAAPYPWTPRRGAPEMPWPPRGVRLDVRFRAPDSPPELKNVEIIVHYELYDGIPVLAKWVTVQNTGPEPVTVDGLSGEILAVTEQECRRLHVESNYAFNTMNTTQWGPDSEYTSQVDYNLQSPVLMTSRYPMGPGVELKQGERFDSFRTLVLVLDSDDRERRGLARRRMYRTLAPQVCENPILMHVRESTSDAVRLAVDQCAEVGFEMVIMTFWSGFDMEAQDAETVARYKADADYGRSKGVELGGYTLMCASRDVGSEFNCISPDTGEPGSMFGQSACLASAWADGYFDRVNNLLDSTGLMVVETDGPYHGDKCASTEHAHHRGLEDSQLRQWQRCAEFYHGCRERGIYVNSPDWYYLNGSNKCAMGYREVNWSLPRDQQVILGRQNIYDGTFEKTPSMGWMFVPLVEYHGGGPAATLEPLSEHLAEYEWHLAQNFGSGVQACYRGPRLYDTDATKAVVKKWVDFYKAHRPILDSDIIHVRRADGRNIDCMLHANPLLEERGLAMVYNPSPDPQSTTLRLPLYYTGLKNAVLVREQDGEPVEYALARDCCIELPVDMPPKSITWFVVTAAVGKE